MVPRPSWDDYFMDITQRVATRSTCLRRQVGAVIVLGKRMLATGYNGAPRGMPHCDETGCLRAELGIPSGQRQEICRGLHAEQNAIIQAALHGVSVAGGTIYVTHQPCITCAKMIINAGIERVVCAHTYPDELARSFLAEAGVVLDPWVPEAQSDTAPEAGDGGKPG
ncbi:MAG TPA: cytidine/deoxycytidylate deaminase family protein [Anaerolineae bacterium]|nr:cytidine/deoxycytidylate deaminase family protein [Anaerolineae bacterium]HOR00853.1 cytidine/deoxycytidylate deaminase family protein [Anaerolineae bacterium]HPL29285.1 cytidine/deoxycytidylate deaminase family protein [Anaerolineae bacterium]